MMGSKWEIKMLLVETNEVVISLVEKALKNSRLRYFLKTIDSIENLEFELQFNQPQLILSGRTMEGFTAKEVMLSIQASKARIPVVMIASDHNLKKNMELILLGVYEIILLSDLKRLPQEVSYLKEKARFRFLYDQSL